MTSVMSYKTSVSPALPRALNLDHLKAGLLIYEEISCLHCLTALQSQLSMFAKKASILFLKMNRSGLKSPLKVIMEISRASRSCLCDPFVR